MYQNASLFTFDAQLFSSRHKMHHWRAVRPPVVHFVANKHKNCASKVHKHIKISCIISKVFLSGAKRLKGDCH
jgi:hypothetical protein